MDAIINFVRNAGIEIEEKALNEDSFLPGILIKDGRMYIDREKVLYPGDILHEAGHLAVMLPEERKLAGNNVSDNKNKDMAQAEEMMAIAWSYAALVHLQLSPEVVFHPAGYRGASEWYISQFTGGNYIGLPMLQWIGLCHDEKNAKENNTEPFPYMMKWVRV